MFTVRVKKHDGIERLYECEEITAEPNALLLHGTHFGGIDSMEILGPGGEMMAHDWDRNQSHNTLSPVIGEGIAYVMNRYGKTVATYHLPLREELLTQQDQTVSEDVSNKPKLLIPLKENDFSNVLWANDPGFILVDKEANLLDLSRKTNTLGYDRVDRVPLIDPNGRIKSLIVSITTPDSDIQEYLVLDVTRDGSSLFRKNKENPFSYEAFPTYNFIVDTDVSMWLCDSKEFISKIVQKYPLPRERLLTLEILVKFSRTTGMITATGSAECSAAQVNLVAYSVELYEDLE